MPWLPELRGATLFGQAALLDPLGALPVAAFSAALQIQVGDRPSIGRTFRTTA